MTEPIGRPTSPMSQIAATDTVSGIFQVTVVGSRFIGIDSKSLMRFDTFLLQPQPENVHDPNAIAVLAMVEGEYHRVGWVARDSQKDVPEIQKESGEVFKVFSAYMETRNAINIYLLKD